jgi:hypothetical protein
LPDVVSQKELNIQFKELKGMITRVSGDDSAKDALKYFDFVSWLESRIENTSYAEILKSKVPHDLPVT